MSVKPVAEEGQIARLMYHYTDKDGYNSIRARVDWSFRAHLPPPRDTNHPLAAYFTTLGPETKGLSPRISLPGVKLEFVFVFRDVGDLVPLRGGRGRWIFYSTEDYVVAKDRQIDHGETIAVATRLRQVQE